MLNHPYPLRKHQGFTLIELMVTVAILAILITIAAPNFLSLLESWRVRQVTENLRSSLQFARSEAIKRGGHVVMQKITTNPNGCKAPKPQKEWDCGWLICADINKNDKCTKDDTELLRYDSSGKVHITRTGGAETIKFNRYGLVDGPYVCFNLVPQDQKISHPATRGLCMSSGGRIETKP